MRVEKAQAVGPPAGYSRGSMLGETEVPRNRPDDYVEFWPAGETVKGEFHCADCGYGVMIVRALPACPMCGCSSWERTDWSPLTHARSLL